MQGSSKISASLDRPVKRIGFVILAVGVVVSLIGFIQIGSDLYKYRWVEKFIEGVFESLCFNRYNFRFYPMASIGPYMALAGLLLSYLYDRGIGRLLAWVRNG